jgi:hypothetical protein
MTRSWAGRVQVLRLWADALGRQVAEDFTSQDVILLIAG